MCVQMQREVASQPLQSFVGYTYYCTCSHTSTPYDKQWDSEMGLVGGLV